MTARDERPSGRASTLRRAADACFICLARDIWVIAEWKVPPEKVPRERTTPRSVIGTSSGSCWTAK